MNNKEPLIQPSHQDNFSNFGSQNGFETKPEYQARRFSSRGSITNVQINGIINLHLNDPESAEAFHIFFEHKITDYDTVDLIICGAIEQFNKRFTEQQLPYQLQTNPILYKLKIAKKNGRPKTDYPDLDLNIKLASVNFQKFALIPSPQAILRLDDNGEVIGNFLGNFGANPSLKGSLANSKRISNTSSFKSSATTDNKMEKFEQEQMEQKKCKCKCVIF